MSARRWERAVSELVLLVLLAVLGYAVSQDNVAAALVGIYFLWELER